MMDYLYVFLCFLFLVLGGFLIFAIAKTAEVKGKAKAIQNARLSIGMDANQVIKILGNPDNVGSRADGTQIYTWSIDTKNYSSIFNAKTYHMIRVEVKDGKVSAYETV